MGLRINSLMAGALKILDQKKTSTPSRADDGESSNPVFDAASELASPQRFSTPPSKLSDSLNAAYALSQLSARTPPLSPEKSLARDQLSNDSTQPSREAMKYSLEGSGIDIAPQNPVPEPSQEDLNLLREALVREAKDTALHNPDITEEDLQSAIDAKFGEGLSEIISIRIQDQGFGASDIEFSQVNWSELSRDQQDLFADAAAYAQKNYQPRGDIQEPQASDGSKFLESASIRYQSGRFA